MTTPLRVGVRATQVWLRAAEQTIAVVAETTRRLIGGARSDEKPARPSAPRHKVFEQPLAAPPPEAPAPDEPAPEPVHVSEAPELVDAVAEPGAEEGAGASVHIEPPWNGYDHMKAADVVDRLTGANAAELAAVQLYEANAKGRKTVLEAAGRELRISTSSGSQR
ncbi:MAG TPA: hypothetical protein VGF81_13530 [Solirubrobacteraceae bacterium]